MFKHLLLIFLSSLISFSVLAQVRVEIQTTAGNIGLELNDKEAPITVKNFLDYVKSGFYEGTIFHRVIKDFVIQGGGLDENLRQKPTNPPIINESSNGLSNLAGTIAMARTSDPNSATSQFYINLVDNLFLDKSESNPGYAVFGKVVYGFDVVKIIGAALTNPNDVPTVPIVIKKVEVKDDGK